MSTDTVTRVMSQPEAQLARAMARTKVLEALPDLAQRLVKLGQKDNLEAILAALRGQGVVSNKHEVEVTQGRPKRHK